MSTKHHIPLKRPLATAVSPSAVVVSKSCNRGRNCGTVGTTVEISTVAWDDFHSCPIHQVKSSPPSSFRTGLSLLDKYKASSARASFDIVIRFQRPASLHFCELAIRQWKDGRLVIEVRPPPLPWPVSPTLHHV